jgi:ArsR family transcriptional regulator, lead/cadmium/zinc/bismuth-responsive transcriptional repressor
MATHGELLHIDAAQGERLRAARPATELAERLAGGYRALGEPTRLGLALALRDGGELCVCDLSWIAERTQNLVSHHMKVLKADGVVRARKDGKMTIYALTQKGQALLGAITAELD